MTGKKRLSSKYARTGCLGGLGRNLHINLHIQIYVERTAHFSLVLKLILRLRWKVTGCQCEFLTLTQSDFQAIVQTCVPLSFAVNSINRPMVDLPCLSSLGSVDWLVEKIESYPSIRWIRNDIIQTHIKKVLKSLKEGYVINFPQLNSNIHVN